MKSALGTRLNRNPVCFLLWRSFESHLGCTSLVVQPSLDISHLCEPITYSWLAPASTDTATAPRVWVPYIPCLAQLQ